MKYLFTFLLIGVLCPLVFTGCDIINPAEDIPAYLYIEEFDITSDPVTQGTDHAEVTEVWVTVDGNFLGAYSPPALVPILAAGPSQIRVEAGIKENGISTLPDIYPFYDPFEVTRTLEPNVVDTLRPQVGYVPRTVFSYVEDFEDGDNHFFKDLRIGNTTNVLQVQTEEVFEGDASARVRLDTSGPIFELATTRRFQDLISVSPFVYLEVNYKSDVPVSFGLVGFRQNDPTDPGTSFYEAGFLPSNEWRKIYFILSRLIINSQTTKDEYKIAFRAALPVENGSFSVDEANIYLDNIKLLNF